MLFKTEKSNRKKIKLITTPYGWKKKKIKKLINPIILYSIIIPFFFFCNFSNFLSTIPELGDQMVDHYKHLQLGKFISGTGMNPTAKWHKCIGFRRNLHYNHENQNQKI